MFISISKNLGTDLCRLEAFRRALGRNAVMKERKSRFPLSGKIVLLGEEIILKKEIPALAFILLFFLLALAL